MKMDDFAKRAAAVGLSPQAYAKANIHAKGKLGAQARMAYTMMGTHGSGKSNMGGAGDPRSPENKLYQIG